MIIPVIPPVALAGFAVTAVRYGVRKQWLNAIVCLLCGFAAFLVIQSLTSKSPTLAQERQRITILEAKVSAIEAHMQQLPQPKEAN